MPGHAVSNQVPNAARAISRKSRCQIVWLDYKNETGSGNTLSYTHKLGTSTDVKGSYSAKIKLGPASSEFAASIGVSFDSNNSWGNTATSDATTTSTTGIKISHA